MNHTEQHYYEVAGDIPEEFEYLRRAADEAGRLKTEIYQFADGEFSGLVPRPMTRSGLELRPLQCDARYLIESEYETIRNANTVIDACDAGNKIPLYEMVLAGWEVQLKRESDYHAYNIKALAKRHAKGSPANEIARVQGLIDEGAAKIALLSLRVEWAGKQCAS